MTQFVKWDTATLMSAPRKNRPNQRETKVKVICSHCAKSRWLTKRAAECAAKKNACKYCTARKGFQAMIKQYGRGYVMEKLAAYRKENPSTPEVAAATILDRMGVVYERECLVKSNGRYALYDFLIGNIVVEIDGDYFHKNKHDDHERQKRIAAENGLIIKRVLVSNLEQKLPELINSISGIVA